MKKQLLAIALILLGFGAYSQTTMAVSTIWKPYSLNLDTTWGVRWLSVVDSNTVWAVGYNGAAPTSSSSRFSRTQDGVNFITGSFLPDTNNFTASNISAVNDSVAYIPCYFKAGSGRAGRVMKTMNRGLTWSNCTDTTNMFTGTANFPDWAHFYNNKRGIVLGDPNGGNFEIYHTYNGGTSWTRVPSANIPTPTSGEYGVTDVVATYGSKFIWFGTIHQTSAVNHIYRSNDTGHTWQAAAIPNMLGGVNGVAFRDSMHGMAWGFGSTTAPQNFLLERTSDGGATWTTVFTRDMAGTNDFSAFGKTGFMSVGLDSTTSASGALSVNGFVTSVTHDDGNTWTVLEAGPTGPGINASALRMLRVRMLDSIHGWAGNFEDNTMPRGNNGINKFVANGCITSISGVASICNGSSTTLTAQGSFTTYTWSPGGANTSTITVSPTSNQVYTVVASNGGCTDSYTYPVAVVSSPTVAITSTVTTICSGKPTQIVASGATSYTWSVGSSHTATISVSPTSQTVYTVNGSVSGCVGAPTSFTLSTIPNPTITVSSSVASDTICSGSNTTLTAGGASTYSWSPATGLSTTSGSVSVASPTVTTTYSITGTGANTCSTVKTIKIVVKTCVGINQLSVNNTQVSFYPNPSNGLIEVAMENVKAGTSLYVSDLLGNEVYKTTLNANAISQKMSIDLSTLPKGIYLFGVSNGNQSRVQKLIIQ